MSTKGSDKDATIRSWRNSVSQENRFAEYKSHPSQLIYEQSEKEMLTMVILQSRAKSMVSSQMTMPQQIPCSQCLSKIDKGGWEPTRATVASTVPAFIPLDNNTKLKSNVKMPIPEKYDGSPDFDKFERFIFSANTYYNWAELTGEERIQHAQSLLRGTAAHFYMQNIVRKPSEWTMSQFGKELFNYCFL